MIVCTLFKQRTHTHLNSCHLTYDLPAWHWNACSPWTLKGRIILLPRNSTHQGARSLKKIYIYSLVMHWHVYLIAVISLSHVLGFITFMEKCLLCQLLICVKRFLPFLSTADYGVHRSQLNSILSQMIPLHLIIFLLSTNMFGHIWIEQVTVRSVTSVCPCTC